MRAFLTRLLYFARRRRYLAIWSAGLLTIAVVIAGAFSPFSPLDRLNFLVFDTYQKLRPRPAAESAVRSSTSTTRASASSASGPGRGRFWRRSSTG